MAENDSTGVPITAVSKTGALPAPVAVPFSYATMAKKGAVYAVNALAAYLAVRGIELSPEAQAALAVLIGAALAMLRNKVKQTWPDTFGWL